jgi:hypothetical protein
MKCMNIWLAFFLAVCMATVTFFVAERNCTNASQILHQAELSRAADKASVAYFTHSLAVARWELEHFNELLNSTHGSSLKDQSVVWFYRFTTCARLARVCREASDVEAYDKYLARALEFGRPFDANLKDAGTLFELVEKMDRHEKQQEGYPGTDTKP